MRIRLAAVLLALSGITATARADDPDPARAERRALAYLGAEVPRWARENRCYSCHNNGDAARALYLARKLGRAVGVDAADPAADTTRWLSRPDGWERNGGDGAFSDKGLARVQFTAALAAAIAAGAAGPDAPDALRTAAGRLARDQSADGSWPIEDGQGSIGTPAAYGRPLATLVARDALAAADPDRHRDPIARADAWLRARPVARVMDASTYLLAFPRDDGPKAAQAIATLRAGRSTDGGWGPFVDAPPEPFDTALALLALARRPPSDEVQGWIDAGRAYLARSQSDDGSWPETTRPAGLESYAQRLSTAGWATLALLSTAPRPARPAP